MSHFPSEICEPFTSLMKVLAQAFECEQRPGGDAAATAMRDSSMESFRAIASHADPGCLLDQACKHPDALAIATFILACRDVIAWHHWEGDGLEGVVSSKLYTAELVGPDGHIANDHVRVGLLISDQDTDYPLSSHAGEETHFVISGIAEWSIDGASYQKYAPGSFIHHQAWTPHGRRTLKEPFLGAWRWSGDLDLSTFSVIVRE